MDDVVHTKINIAETFTLRLKLKIVVSYFVNTYVIILSIGKVPMLIVSIYLLDN